MTAQQQVENSGHDAWLQERIDFVTGQYGYLNLVGLHIVDNKPGQLGDLPGLWSSNGSQKDNGTAVKLQCTQDDGITIDGSPVSGEIELDKQMVLHLSPTVTARVGQEEDGIFFVQVWDSESINRRTFASIDTFDYDDAYKLRAMFREADPSRRLEIGRASAALDDDTKGAPADVVFEWEGEEVTMPAFRTFDESKLALMFQDETTGVETPASGRFLVFQRPADGAVFDLDLNKTMLLPYEYSSAFPCAPNAPETRLPFSLRAGERSVNYTD